MAQSSQLQKRSLRGSGSSRRYRRQTDLSRRPQQRGRWFQPSQRRSCRSKEGDRCLVVQSSQSSSYADHVFVCIQTQGDPTQLPTLHIPDRFPQNQQLVPVESVSPSHPTKTSPSPPQLQASGLLPRTEVSYRGHEMSSSQPRRTAGAKVIARHASKDRVINTYPQSQRQDATPYLAFNFNPKVKAACSAQKAVTSSLRICKAIVIGDVAVGKTCLVNRFCKDTFDRDYKATIGVDFEVERFDILNTPFNLQIWDTAGQERFQCIAAAYYRGAHVVIVTFDLLDIKSLENTKNWLEAAMLENTQNEPLIFLVGTKKDLCSKATYEKVEEDAVRTAKELGAEYWGISSKTGEGVTEFFFRVAGLAFNEAVLKEVDVTSPSKQIASSDLIKVDRNTELHEHKKSRCAGKCTA